MLACLLARLTAQLKSFSHHALVFLVLLAFVQFVSVVIDNFKKMKQQMIVEGSIFMTETQQRWVEVQRVIQRKPPEMLVPPLDDNQLRLKCFEIVQRPKFDGFIMACIMLNVCIMALTFKGEPDWVSGL